MNIAFLNAYWYLHQSTYQHDDPRRHHPDICCIGCYIPALRKRTVPNTNSSQIDADESLQLANSNDKSIFLLIMIELKHIHVSFDFD